MTLSFLIFGFKGCKTVIEQPWKSQPAFTCQHQGHAKDGQYTLFQRQTAGELNPDDLGWSDGSASLLTTLEYNVGISIPAILNGDSAIRYRRKTVYWSVFAGRKETYAPGSTPLALTRRPLI